jgi:hypothetical protein
MNLISEENGKLVCGRIFNFAKLRAQRLGEQWVRFERDLRARRSSHVPVEPFCLRSMRSGLESYSLSEECGNNVGMKYRESWLK